MVGSVHILSKCKANLSVLPQPPSWFGANTCCSCTHQHWHPLLQSVWRKITVNRSSTLWVCHYWKLLIGGVRFCYISHLNYWIPKMNNIIKFNKKYIWTKDFFLLLLLNVNFISSLKILLLSDLQTNCTRRGFFDKQSNIVTETMTSSWEHFTSKWRRDLQFIYFYSSGTDLSIVGGCAV